MPPPISLRELRDTMGRVRELGAFGAQQLEGPPPPTTEMHPVQITSTTQTAGRYPGTLYTYDADLDTYTAYLAGDIWVDRPNSETLATGTYYWAKLVGTKASDGKMIFQVVGASSSAKSFCSAWLNADVICTSGIAKAVEFNNEIADTDDYHSTSSNKELFTVPADGLYSIHAAIVWEVSDAGAYRLVQLAVNSNIVARDWRPPVAGWAGNPVPVICQVSWIGEMVAGQEAFLWAKHDAGVNLKVTWYAAYGTSYFQIAQIAKG
jgi:hypothetical protein